MTIVSRTAVKKKEIKNAESEREKLLPNWQHVIIARCWRHLMRCSCCCCLIAVTVNVHSHWRSHSESPFHRFTESLCVAAAALCVRFGLDWGDDCLLTRRNTY